MLQNEVLTPFAQEKCTISLDDIFFINKLFRELKAIFPAYNLAIPNDDVERDIKKSWVKALQEAGLTSTSKVKLGLKRARASGKPFLPAVAEFCQWCQPLPEDVGLLCIDLAFIEARNNYRYSSGVDWSHPAVAIASKKTGNRGFSLSDEGAMDIFTKHYLHSINRVFHGEDLSGEVSKELPLKETKKAEKAVSDHYIAKFRNHKNAHHARLKLGHSSNATNSEDFQ